eukprot:1103575-Pyramimonas_sp.AAC.1
MPGNSGRKKLNRWSHYVELEMDPAKATNDDYTYDWPIHQPWQRTVQHEGLTATAPLNAARLRDNRLR